jgi:hypothetical protein
MDEHDHSATLPHPSFRDNNPFPSQSHSISAEDGRGLKPKRSGSGQSAVMEEGRYDVVREGGLESAGREGGPYINLCWPGGTFRASYDGYLADITVTVI